MKWFRRKKDSPAESQDALNAPWVPKGVVRTHTGLVREHNEDAIMLYTSHQDNGMSPTLALVADGMGGHAAGEVASRICADTFANLVRDASDTDPIQLLTEGMHTANEAIFSAAQKDDALHGMGTTCSAMLIRNGKAWIANVGDSRIYVFDQGQLEQITHDDTVVNQWLAEGRITRAEAAEHPDANILTQALGTKPKVRCKPSVVTQSLKPGVRILLCSDGLYDMVREKDISGLMQIEDMEKCTDALVSRALENGGRDNVSVIVIECTPREQTEDNNNQTGYSEISSQR